MRHQANLLVTEQDIDALCNEVRTNHVDLMVACDLLQLDTKTVLKLRAEGADPESTGLARYAFDEVRKAEAEAERFILQQILNTDPDFDPQRGKLLLSFLEKTKSRYSNRHNMRIEYEVEALLEYTSRFIPKDQLMEWITGLALMSGKQLVLAQDEKLLR
jgi:hypothetical protein